MAASISICIPTYNRPLGMERLLQSIAMQKYSNHEIVITDDSHNNETELLVAKWSNKLSITYLKNSKSLGSPANWNKAVSLAKYDWIKLMHDDDWFEHENVLQLFVDATSKADFIFCGNNNVYFNEKRIIKEALSDADKNILSKDPMLLFYRNVIGHPSNTMYKKNTLTYDEQFKWVVDVDFYMRYLLASQSFFYINEILINTGIDATTVSNVSYKNPKVEIPEYLKMLQKLGNELLLSNAHVFAAIWTLVKKFSIKNIESVSANGYNGAVADGVLRIINAQKNVPKLMIKQTPISNYLMQRNFNKLKK